MFSNFLYIKNRGSLLVALLIIVYIVSWPFINGWPNPLTWDTFGYYLYMPMSYIHNDLGMNNFSLIENLQKEQFVSPTLYQLNKTPTGNWLIRYPMGLSVLLSPFYFIGHLFAKIGGYSQNGFSLPYQIAIISGCLVYISSSILLLRKILLNWFSDKVVLITLLIIVFGTNYSNQATVSSAMPHALLFFVYTLIILTTIKWHKNKSKLNAIFLGGIIGLATICRPTEIVSVFIPLFWEVKNLKELKIKFLDVWNNYKASLFFIVFSFGLVVFMQLLYWKIYAGSFIYNSYANPAEGLDLLSPYTFKVLFSFRKGWLIYTPIMIFAIVGFYYLKKKKAEYFLSFVLYAILNLYLVSSWTCWWYAGSFGQRTMVQSYVVMAIALAFLIQQALTFKPIKKNILFSVIGILFCLNVFQIWQTRKGILHADRMTFAYYKAIFGKTNIEGKNYESLLLYDRNLTFKQAIKKYSYKKETIYSNSYEYLQETEFVSRKNKRFGEKALKMSANHEFSKPYTIKYSELANTSYVWLEISFWAYITDSNTQIRLVTAIDRKGNNYGYKAYGLIQNKQEVELNKWKKYTYHYLTPHIRNIKDKFTSYFWHAGGGEVYIDDFSITRYSPK